MSDRVCPNCGGPERRSTGICDHMGIYYWCGYQDSDDGIEPPKITPICAYAKGLLDASRL